MPELLVSCRGVTNAQWKMQRTVGGWWSLAQRTAVRPCARTNSSAASEHAERRGGEVDPERTPVVRERSPGRSVRAGFMLMPDSGASKVMYGRDEHAGERPVKRASRGVLELCRTIDIMPNEIAGSAAKATSEPARPGTVAT